MTAMPIPLEAGRATCADPQHLPLVDAAFEQPGGPEAQQMKHTLCRHCPIAHECITWAMTHAEAGIWGGTSPKARTIHGAPNQLPTVPDYLHRGRTEGIPAEPWRRKKPAPRKSPGPRIHNTTPSQAATRCAQLGVRERDVKRWAYDQGLVTTIKGRVALTPVEQYAAAHQDP